MGYKTISLSDKAYNVLKTKKLNKVKIFFLKLSGINKGKPKLYPLL